MIIGWPQGIWLAITFAGLGVVLAKDGEPKGNYSFGLTLACSIVNIAVLYWGGFFG